MLSGLNDSRIISITELVAADSKVVWRALP